MNIINYDSSLRADFEEMLVEYFSGDLSCGIPEDILRGRLLEHILSHVRGGITRLCICTENSIPMGFSLYQIDSEASDWCKRPGWGCIREFYIRKGYRGKGNGTALAAHTEQQLRAMGAEHVYLTADDAVRFWEHCGYSNTHEICSNDLEIFTK